jgi:lipopolysaccharide transport system permease protein
MDFATSSKSRVGRAAEMGFNIQFVRLAFDIAIRDVKAKYKRSVAGLLWFGLTPLGMLAIYWTVFGLVFNVSWHHPFTGENVGYVVPFFSGLVLYLFFADIVISSTNLFVSKRTYVIKSSFPLWVLWLGNQIRAGSHGLVNLVILILLALTEQRLSLIGFFWMFVAIVSGLLFVAALSLLLSCLGPFIGDISELAQLTLRVLFYASPVTYPLELVPEKYRFLLWLNPLTHLIEPLRRAVVFDRPPDPTSMTVFNGVSLLLLGVSVWVFKRTRGVIADVV